MNEQRPVNRSQCLTRSGLEFITLIAAIGGVFFLLIDHGRAEDVLPDFKDVQMKLALRGHGQDGWAFRVTNSGKKDTVLLSFLDKSHPFKPRALIIQRMDEHGVWKDVDFSLDYLPDEYPLAPGHSVTFSDVVNAARAKLPRTGELVRFEIEGTYKEDKQRHTFLVRSEPIRWQ